MTYRGPELGGFMSTASPVTLKSRPFCAVNSSEFRGENVIYEVLCDGLSNDKFL